MEALIDNCCGCGTDTCGNALSVHASGQIAHFHANPTAHTGSWRVDWDADGIATESPAGSLATIFAHIYDASSGSYFGPSEYCSNPYAYVRFLSGLWTITYRYDNLALGYWNTWTSETNERYDAELGVLMWRGIRSTTTSYTGADPVTFEGTYTFERNETTGATTETGSLPVPTFPKNYGGMPNSWIKAEITPDTVLIECHTDTTGDGQAPEHWVAMRRFSMPRNLGDVMADAILSLAAVPLTIGASVTGINASTGLEETITIQWKDSYLVEWVGWPKRRRVTLTGRFDAGTGLGWGTLADGAARKSWSALVPYAEKSLVIACAETEDVVSQEQAQCVESPAADFNWTGTETCDNRNFAPDSTQTLYPSDVAYTWGAAQLGLCP